MVPMLAIVARALARPPAPRTFTAATAMSTPMMARTSMSSRSEKPLRFRRELFLTGRIFMNCSPRC
jgi:hypothetical protein